ncbi:hypothetical protein LSCM1_07825 [Leishmania martiniquensis]|uniref:Leucine-rich repeat protein n=1 Tax=Leishmania martiniquensis TaxID=1580590 RepID=A0A836H038_9TRYP|nr:hypothetical protein LSCM1_07825 [Leishmania martiniquensis]
MSSGVAEGAAPKEQEEGVAVSAPLPSAPEPLTDTRGSLTRRSSVDSSLGGELNGAAAPSSPSSVPARLCRDPHALGLGGHKSGRASIHARTSKTSQALRAGFAKGEEKTAAASIKQPPPPLSAAAQPIGNTAAVDEVAACSADALPTGPSALGGAERTAVIESHLKTTRQLPPPGVSTPTESLAAAKGTVLCVELTEMPPPQTSSIALSVSGGRLDLRMRGLVVLPCLHVPAASTAPSSDGRQEPTTPPSAHGSGDAMAGCLHAVSFRQNAISSLLTPCARTFSTPQALPFMPRSSPLHCYTHVSSLDLTHNTLTSIAGIDVLRCLRSLRLAFNRLTSLAPLWASPHVAELDVLDVSSNALTELLSAEDMRSLKRHQIRVITHKKQAHSAAVGQRNAKSSVYKVMCLRVLYASNNLLREVPSAVYTFAQLTDLRLSKNDIDKVPDGFPARVCLPQLRQVDVSMNKLPPAIAKAVAARAEAMAESPRCHCPTSPAAPRASIAEDHRTSMHRSHRDSASSSSAETTAVSSSASRPGDGASLGMAGRGAAECTEVSCGGPLPEQDRREGSGSAVENERGDAAATNDTERSRPSLSAAKAAGGAGSHKSRDALKSNTVALPQSPAAARRERTSAVAPNLPKAKVTTSLLPTAPVTATVSAQEVEQRAPVQRVAENVYCIDLSAWAMLVRRRLEKMMMRSSINSPSGAPGAASAYSMHELLLSLYDILSGSSSSAGATAPPRYRRRLAATAHTLASLLECLSLYSIVYSEEAQMRCAPLLLLTGITAAVVADPSELLLYEVLALHVVHNCLCTVKSVPGGVSSSCEESADSSPTPQAHKGENISEPAIRAKAVVTDHARSLETPPLRPGSPGSSRGVGTSGQLNFYEPLRAIHVITCADSASPAHSSTSALWTYLAWRQRWEAAVSRRRFLSKSSYVCEVGTQVAGVHRPHPSSSKPPHVSAAANGNSTRAALHSAEAKPLYPFAANSPISRVLEWRRLHECRPASYCAVPPPWELLYDALPRPSLPKRAAPQQLREPAIPPLLAGVGNRMHYMRGTPVDLACVLLCSTDYPRCAEAPKVNAPRTLPLPRRPLPGTCDSAASEARNGGFATIASYVACGDIIDRALQLRDYSQQMCCRLEREADTVAAEQVTACLMPLYSAEEVLQSQQAAVAALSSLGSRNTPLRCEPCGQSDVAEEAVESVAVSRKDVPGLQHQCSASEWLSVLQHCVPQSFKSTTATVVDTTVWDHQSETRGTPLAAAVADGGSSPAAGADAACGEAGALIGIEECDTLARSGQARHDNAVWAAPSAAESG